MSTSPSSRRQFLRQSAQLAGAGAFGVPLLGANAVVDDGVRELTSEELIDARTQGAIDKGLRFLASRQIGRGVDRGAFGASSYNGSVGICGIAGLAFMCEGSTPGIGRYGKQVEACTQFLIRNTSATGYIARAGGRGTGNMYGHGFAMLCMTQAYGMTRQKELGQKLRTAVKLTLSSQNDEGGWRYQPSPTDADLSVTVCQIMALRAARDAGITVPDPSREKTIAYVKKSQIDDGGFRYTLRGGHTTFALTAAGLVSLFSAGIYDGPQIEKGLHYLKKNRSRAEGHYYFYGHYYAVQAMWHAGGQWWNDWYPQIRDSLLKKQRPDGSWSSPYSDEFGTAMACIILQMPNDRLPVFAR
ncbi:MAG: hypothetical protein L7V86_28270 [Verrucomicrobiales bacterium]|nr:hypothetical protein [Verrucomicrobiales bacterium]